MVAGIALKLLRDKEWGKWRLFTPAYRLAAVERVWIKVSVMKISVAPMMDWTDRHCRMFHRALSKEVLLYTEMVVADAAIHGPKERLLGFSEEEHPVALQLGGSDPAKLAEATRIGAGFGYDEINLNIGCPSDRVQSGRFGACLMSEAKLVRDCMSAMAEVSPVPVTVKCRLGIDDQAVEQTLPHFIETVAQSGCEVFIIHARKAWLQGLSPKDNRTIPPLDYDLVRRMKVEFPHLEIHLNGGLKTVEEGQREAETLDGVMFGRAAYQDPWMLSEIDAVFDRTREDVVEEMIRYAERCETEELRHNALLRHMLGLFAGQPGARVWRRYISTHGPQGRPAEVLGDALALMKERAFA